MKKPEEILKKWYNPLHGIGDIAELQIVEAMKEYAIEFTKQHLKTLPVSKSLEYPDQVQWMNEGKIEYGKKVMYHTIVFDNGWKSIGIPAVVSSSYWGDGFGNYLCKKRSKTTIMSLGPLTLNF